MGVAALSPGSVGRAAGVTRGQDRRALGTNACPSRPGATGGGRDCSLLPMPAKNRRSLSATARHAREAANATTAAEGNAGQQADEPVPNANEPPGSQVLARDVTVSMRKRKRSARIALTPLGALDARRTELSFLSRSQTSQAARHFARVAYVGSVVCGKLGRVGGIVSCGGWTIWVWPGTCGLTCYAAMTMSCTPTGSCTHTTSCAF